MLEVEIWSDIACPWCWIGKRGLEEALESFDSPVTVRWRAFELNPQAPPGGAEPLDYAQRIADKYGVELRAAQEMVDRMVSAGRDRGLDIRFDRIRPTNTFDAHRLLSWAGSTDRQSLLKELLFKAYLHDGYLVSDPTVLVSLAESAGLDAAEATAILNSNAFSDEVRDDEATAAKIGISGVPCYVFPQAGTGLSGAQPAEVLLETMRRAQASS